MTCTFTAVLGITVLGLVEKTATLKGELWVNTRFVLHEATGDREHTP